MVRRHANKYTRYLASKVGASLLVIALLLTALPAWPARAATTINVTTTADNTTDDTFCSLREAVSYTNGVPINANCGPNGGSPYTINIPAGTYNLSVNELNVGKNGYVTATINGAGAASTIIHQTNPSYRVFSLDYYIFGNVVVTITGVTISGGTAQTFGGGAILGGGPRDALVLSNSIIRDNRTSATDNAAGISWNSGGNLTITNTEFLNNIAHGDGGAIAFLGGFGDELTISGSTFTGNQTTGMGVTPGRGGALFLTGLGPAPFNIHHNTFINNQSTIGSGEAIHLGFGTVNLHYNRIVGNGADDIDRSDAIYQTGGTVNADHNWWGCSTGPGAAPCDGGTSTGGTFTTVPWLRDLLTSSAGTTLVTNESSTLTASFLTNSGNAAVTPPITNLDVILAQPVTWNNSNGSVGNLSGAQGTIQPGGTATGTFTATASGSTTLYARVDNDNTSGSSSNVLSLTINKANTATAITSDLPDPSMSGQTVTVSYTVTGAYGNSPTTPTGNVTVTDGVDACTGTVAAGSCDITLTTAGNRTLIAAYAGDANFNISTSAGESHTVNQSPDIDMQITATSAAETSGTNVAIGEVVTYAILVSFPEDFIVADSVLDDIPGGLAIVAGTPQVITSAAASGTLLTADFEGTIGTQTIIADTSDGGSVQFDFTNIVLSSDGNPDNNVLLLTFQARVTDILANQAGTIISNSATNQVGAAVSTPSNTVDVHIVEPVITFTKTIVSLPTPLDAGGLVHYQLLFSNATGATVSAAEDVHITDFLAAALVLPSPSAPDLVITPTAGVTAVTSSSTSHGIDISVGSVPPGESVTIDFFPAIQASLTPGQVVDNTGNSTWTSLSGAVSGERTGAGGVDDYHATDTRSFTILESPSITSDNSATFTIGSAGTFTVTTTGYPIPAISETGFLPIGVSFTDNGDGTATLSGTPAAAADGTYPITVTANNGVFPNATQDFTLMVNLPTTAALISDLPDPSVVGQVVTFNYTVSVVPPAAGTPTGNVTISNGVDSCTGTVAAGSCTITFTSPGTSSFTATYAGDGIFDNSTSAAVSHTVEMADTTAAITSDTPDPSAVGEVVTVNFTVTPVAPASGTPTGNVTVTDGTNSCTATVAAGTCTITFPSVGPKTLIATYAGDANFAGSISPTTGHTVNMAGTWISITSHAPDPSVVGVPVPVNYSVTVLAPGGGTPTGTVTITDGVDNCTGTVAAGACNLTMTTVGGRLLTASYSGDANYGGSTSFPVGHMVQGPPGVTLINSVADTGDGQVAENEHTPVAITQLLVVFNKDMNADTPGDLDDVLTVSNYSLVQGASTVIPINGVITYNAGTRTATLDVNGGVALPDGVYTLTVLGRIEDTLGAPLGTDFVRHFTIDTKGPAILSNSVVGQPDDQIITDGGLYSSHFTSFNIFFNEDVANAGGGAGVDDVTNPLNYLLLRPGTNAVFDTATCQAFATNGNLPLGDDIRIPTGPVTYNNGGGGPFMAAVTVNGGAALPDGEYRLLVCGSTSIVDLTGNLLNGGADSIYNFSIRTAKSLPSTGFVPGQVTALPIQPASKAYAATDMLLEIPALKQKLALVGVPQTENGWDVTWLGNNAGWLNGTAFPTWDGNSVITAHVWDARNQPGPFVNLKSLKYGDQVRVHAWGQVYTYEVRESFRTGPQNLQKVMRHEELSWLTLVTCEDYKLLMNTYSGRRVVRAVLVDVR